MFIFSFIICNFSGKNELPYIRLSVWRKVPREKSISGESRPVSSWVSGAGAMQAEAASPYLESNEGHVEAGRSFSPAQRGSCRWTLVSLNQETEEEEQEEVKKWKERWQKVSLVFVHLRAHKLQFCFSFVKTFLTIVLTCFIPKTNGKRACTFRQVCLSSCLRCTS